MLCALAGSGHEEATRSLMQYLNEESPWLRREAVERVLEANVGPLAREARAAASQGFEMVELEDDLLPAIQLAGFSGKRSLYDEVLKHHRSGYAPLFTLRALARLDAERFCRDSYEMISSCRDGMEFNRIIGLLSMCAPCGCRLANIRG